jgi:superfamily II DNA/RNA helicase
LKWMTAQFSSAEVFGVEAADATEEEATGARFDDLGLSSDLCKALTDSGYTHPTTVQVQAIPAAMNGADLLVASSTGSGKTAAFMLPALERIVAARGDNKRREKGKVHGPRVLVLAPTRELAMQVAKAASTYGKHLQGLRVATIVGGVPYGAQLKASEGPSGCADRHTWPSARSPEHRRCRARPTWKCWFWTKPTACWTWASSMTSKPSLNKHQPNVRH